MKVKKNDTIKVFGKIDLTISQGKEEDVSVNSASDELIARTKTVVENGVLKIYLDDKGWNWGGSSDKISVKINDICLNRLKASGAFIL